MANTAGFCTEQLKHMSVAVLDCIQDIIYNTGDSALVRFVKIQKVVICESFNSHNKLIFVLHIEQHFLLKKRAML